MWNVSGASNGESHACYKTSAGRRVPHLKNILDDTIWLHSRQNIHSFTVVYLYQILRI